MDICDFVYSVVLKPRPLRVMANACLRAMLPERVVRQGATIVLNQKDPVVSGALALNVYEPEQTSFFLAACEPGSVFLDIGANSGYYTALFLSHAGPGGRAIALEPDPECFELLQRTVQANGGTNTTCLQVAASDVRGTARLYRNGQNRGDNRLYWHDMATSACEVRVNKVDSVLAQLQIPEVNLIKMDVQGFEAVALRGMQDTLDRSARLIILSEFWPSGIQQTGENPVSMLRSLADKGFQTYHLARGGRLMQVCDYEQFARSYTGRRYTTVVAAKGVDVRKLFGQRS